VRFFDGRRGEKSGRLFVRDSKGGLGPREYAGMSERGQAEK
jgi:hypothetical protein